MDGVCPEVDFDEAPPGLVACCDDLLRSWRPLGLAMTALRAAILTDRRSLTDVVWRRVGEHPPGLAQNQAKELRFHDRPIVVDLG